MRTPIKTLTLSCLLMANSSVFAAEDLTVSRTIDLCLEYNSANAERKEVLKTEIDRRGMISFKDQEGMPKGEVYKGSSTCGLYMIKGKPLAEQARQLRPLTYKVVHVYPDKYYVSQSGLIMDILDRKEGELPPQLVHEVPAVQPPPVIYNTPGGSHSQ
ncbi:hypothetical protein THMIRHAT_11670 [Thiosulfativibrio zosterae]|uniref:Uncharacterized protein n=2 Tax=Thiosulfativibrio zosterae TaxID=2675053 RepID=A0A6F8PMT1_9GAMM|nr:hypothetical protein THMIRHAT_11670 [Thiosulfativibrio zosterae]